MFEEPGDSSRGCPDNCHMWAEGWKTGINWMVLLLLFGIRLRQLFPISWTVAYQYMGFLRSREEYWVFLLLSPESFCYKLPKVALQGDSCSLGLTGFEASCSRKPGKKSLEWIDEHNYWWFQLCYIQIWTFPFAIGWCYPVVCYWRIIPLLVI